MNKLKQYAAASFIAVSTAFTSISHAALDATAVTAVATEVTTDANLVFDTMLPVVGIVIAMVVGLKLIKRFSNKV